MTTIISPSAGSLPVTFRTAFAACLAVVFAPATAHAQAPTRPAGADLVAAIDTVFLEYAANDAPGCAVGVSRTGEPELFRAYGMADLENGVAITPGTVFEAGSVSKQFTAAATILLSLDGKISLDDDVRTYIPEVPDYGETITIRHLLNHTSGLRDWGSVAAMEGWPRGSRVHTHDHMLDIVRRQEALNYPPGTFYSYTNTGYNLQAVLVERVSGMSFADFSRERIFEPLGLEDTQWRDDYTRVVRGRAQAYAPVRGGGVRIDMPYENVHGNGGLLTTVGDLLRWTETLESGELAGEPLLEEMHRRGTLTDGRTIDYASGLTVGEYRGVSEVSHGGATAGYRAYLTRYPEQGAAVALLCNTAGANPGRLAHRVADLVLGDAVREVAQDGEPDGDGAPVEGVSLPADALAARTGMYRNARNHEPIRLEIRNGSLALAGGPELVAVSEREFRAEGGQLTFAGAEGRTELTLIPPGGELERFEPVESFDPSPADLEVFTGAYHSREADATYRVELDGGRLTVQRPFAPPLPMRPAYRDAFDSPLGIVRFDRDAEGRVVEMHLGSSRVWDMVFRRDG